MSARERRPSRAGVSPFGLRIVWVVAAAAALAVTLFFYIFGEEPVEVRSAGADVFSRSALGYHALVSFLREDGARVRVSRYAPLRSVGPDAGLLLLEPPTDPAAVAALRTLIGGAVERSAPVVVVLPEWRGRPDPHRSAWLARVEPIPVGEVDRLLGALVEEGGTSPALLRLQGGGEVHAFTGPLAAGLAPQLDDPQVLPRDLPGFEPLMATAAGPIVARDRERGLTVVSDPDLFDTHGLGRGDNAALAHRLFVESSGTAAPGGPGKGGKTPAAWVVDETLHGHRRVPSLARELLELPLVMFTLQAALLAVLGAWVAARRFGKALAPPPRVAAGAGALIDNTARLLAFGGHHAAALDRYLDVVLSDAGTAFGVPPGLRRRERVARLAALAAARDVGEDLEDVARRAAALRGAAPGQAVMPRAFKLARRLWAWREEVLDGSR